MRVCLSLINFPMGRGVVLVVMSVVLKLVVFRFESRVSLLYILIEKIVYSKK